VGSQEGKPITISNKVLEVTGEQVKLKGKDRRWTFGTIGHGPDLASVIMKAQGHVFESHRYRSDIGPRRRECEILPKPDRLAKSFLATRKVDCLLVEGAETQRTLQWLEAAGKLQLPNFVILIDEQEQLCKETGIADKI
jgi:hypothetical protein